MKLKALFLLLTVLAGAALAETVEWISFYPASIPGGDYHVRRLAVGTPYDAENPAEGWAILSGSMGIGTTAPAGLLEVVGLDDQTSRVLLVPGEETPDTGLPDIRLGIGTSVPTAALDVEGEGETILVPRTAAGTDPPGINGMIYYNAAMGKFRAFEAGQWKDVTSGGGGGGGASAGVHTGSYTGNGGSLNFPLPFAPRALFIIRTSGIPHLYIKFGSMQPNDGFSYGGFEGRKGVVLNSATFSGNSFTVNHTSLLPNNSTNTNTGDYHYLALE